MRDLQFGIETLTDIRKLSRSVGLGGNIGKSQSQSC